MTGPIATSKRCLTRVKSRCPQVALDAHLTQLHGQEDPAHHSDEEQADPSATAVPTLAVNTAGLRSAPASVVSLPAMGDLPLHGVPETFLPEAPAAATAALAEALRDGLPAAPRSSLEAVVAAHPGFLDGWARLAEHDLATGSPVTAYAFARVGYHRGLDAVRRAGWRGQGPVPWHHEPNRGFLRSVNALRHAAAAIGETEEEARCAEFLLQLDPEDAQGVRSD